MVDVLVFYSLGEVEQLVFVLLLHLLVLMGHGGGYGLELLLLVSEILLQVDDPLAQFVLCSLDLVGLLLLVNEVLLESLYFRIEEFDPIF